MYNIHRAVRLQGALNTTALEVSVNQIVRRHEVLRATFAEGDGHPLQTIGVPAWLPLPVTDLRSLPEAAREREAGRLAGEFVRKALDLRHGPLMKIALVQLSSEEHVLVIAAHQIVVDDWSMSLLLHELEALYNSYSESCEPAIAPAAIQYGAYAARQRSRAASETFAPHLAYWKEKFSQAPPVIELPSDARRPAAQSYRGARVSRLLPQGLKELQSLSRREGATLFTTLLAAFQALLFRYSSQEYVGIGFRVPGRGPGEQDAVGPYANTLVLVASPAGDPPFREFLHRVQQVLLDAYAHQDLPFEVLVQALHPEPSLSHAPLAQVTFAFDEAFPPALNLRGLKSLPFETETGCSMHDLSLLVRAAPEGLLSTFEYNTDLFKAATIERMLGHFQVLLEGVAANTGARLSQLPLLTSAERRQATAAHNDTARDYPRNRAIHHLFEEQAGRTPDAPAVSFRRRTWTYAELNRRSNQIAHYLRGQGVESGTLVAVSVERSLETIASVLGILKAGAAYVPLDPDYPVERLRWMLENAHPAALLTQQAFAGRFTDYRGPVVLLDKDWPAIRREPVEPPAIGVVATSRAYVIYTSGSTGWPKGVQIAHRSVVHLVHAIRERIRFTSADVLISVASISFDIAVLDFWLPLLTGARLVVADRETCLDGERLAAEIQRSGATMLEATPSVWQILLDAGWTGRHGLVALCGGEAMPAALARQLTSRVKALWNLYGPTETTVWSSAHRVEREQDAALLGHPLANTQFYVLDEHCHLVPAGHPGELFIGGDGVALGYLNSPELTEERFIANPFDSDGSPKLYGTGDRVKRRDDGSLEFLGRIDHQVKLRGFRIELDEVSETLARHPGVKEAVTVLCVEPDRGSYLAAYVAAAKRPVPQAEDLRRFAEACLPSHMVPAEFIVADALPRLPNGKVDRQALTQVLPRNLGPPGEFTAPRDAVEQQLSNIWEALLGRRPIGVTHNFFELGGHSLLAALLLRRIEESFGKKLSMTSVFQAPTIEQLAECLRDSASFAPPAPVIPIQPEGGRPPFVCIGAGPSFLPLARLVGEDQPLIGLDPALLDLSTLSAPYRLEGVAALAVDAIRKVQPTGPYYIGGWCRFGALAFETARQLHEAGDEVGLLALFDSANPLYYSRMPELRRMRLRAHRVAYHLARMMRANIQEAPEYLLERLKVLRYKLRNALTRTGHALFAKPARSSRPDAESILHLASVAYEPGLYSGRVVMFQAADRPAGRDWDMRSVWSEWIAGNVEAYDLPGGHEGMLAEPHVRLLADSVRACLTRKPMAESQHC